MEEVESTKVSLGDRATAAILTGPYGDPYIIKAITIPTPGTQEALVQLDYSGVCHGDVYARDGGGPAPQDPIRPLIGGHEGIGRIVAMGNQGSHGFKIGDTVGIAWRSSVCETCQACKAGAENHCFNQEITGSHRDGTFQSTYHDRSFSHADQDVHAEAVIHRVHHISNLATSPDPLGRPITGCLSHSLRGRNSVRRNTSHEPPAWEMVRDSRSSRRLRTSGYSVCQGFGVTGSGH